MANKRLEMEDEMSRFERSMGNMTALLHSLSLAAISVDIGAAELSRAIEAVWELSRYHERRFTELEDMLEQIEEKAAVKEAEAS